jgi:hypothetical protein
MRGAITPADRAVSSAPPPLGNQTPGAHIDAGAIVRRA